MRTLSQLKSLDVKWGQEDELTFQCPVCHAIETIYFENGTLIKTRNWKQIKNNIYHRDCVKPAKLINMYGHKVFVRSNMAVFMLRILEQRQESIGQFAVNTGISRITVKRWLLGTSHPNRKHRKRIIDYAKKSRITEEVRA